jgi:hypothetical protein
VDGVEGHLLDQKIGAWEQVAKLLPGCRLRRLYSAVGPKKIKELVSQATKSAPKYNPPNFLSYFVVDCPTRAKAEALVKELRSWEAVQKVYIARPVTSPSVNLAATVPNPFWRNQHHLEPAPVGIDAFHAWGLVGGDGAGQSVIDLEQGWALDHPDLAPHHPTLLGGTILNFARPHGTKALGIICAQGNPDGCVGIAPNVATVKTISDSGIETDIPQAIMVAISNLSFGDVLVLEVETDGAHLPCEVDQATFEAIQLATNSGVVVIEAAGNGNDNLDEFVDENSRRRLNRGHADFEDSGAIMVGAGRFNPNGNSGSWTRWPLSNHGSRIDCYAAGEFVFTISSDANGQPAPPNNFGGTSSATAIVAGAALSVQGVEEAKNGSPFPPGRLRDIFSDPTKGTPPRQPQNNRIGVMPDLRKIL